MLCNQSVITLKTFRYFNIFHHDHGSFYRQNTIQKNLSSDFSALYLVNVSHKSCYQKCTETAPTIICILLPLPSSLAACLNVRPAAWPNSKPLFSHTRTDPHSLSNDQVMPLKGNKAPSPGSSNGCIPANPNVSRYHLHGWLPWTPGQGDLCKQHMWGHSFLVSVVQICRISRQKYFLALRKAKEKQPLRPNLWL